MDTEAIDDCIKLICDGTIDDKRKAIVQMAVLSTQGVDVMNFYNIMHENIITLELNCRDYRFIAILDENCFPLLKYRRDSIWEMIKTMFFHRNPQILSINIKKIAKIVDNSNLVDVANLIINASRNSDPYVQKTAALAILSVFLTNNYFLSPGFIERLKEMLISSNINVAIASLSVIMEINSMVLTPIHTPNNDIIFNLLSSIDQATEWSQIQLMDSVSQINFRNDVSSRVLQYISSRLTHINSGVVISAIRCSIIMINNISDPNRRKNIITSIFRSIMNSFNTSHSTQYIVLKSLLPFIHHYQFKYTDSITWFFCAFDDPTYIKMAKLDIIISLANIENISKIIEALFDYSQQADIAFSRKSISTLGKIALMFPDSASDVVEILDKLFKTHVRYIVQECIIITVDILRKYDQKYLGIIKTIAESLNDLDVYDDHQAKMSVIWIFGQYPEIITNIVDLFESLFLDDFLEQTPNVQLAILTAVCKIFVYDSDSTNDLLSSVIKMVIENVENPDLRDRASMYLCLLENHINDFSKIIAFPDGLGVTVNLNSITNEVSQKFVLLFGTLSNIYAKMPYEFVESEMIMNGLRDNQPTTVQVDKKTTDMTKGKLEIQGNFINNEKSRSLQLRIRNFGNKNEIIETRFKKNPFGHSLINDVFPLGIESKETLTLCPEIVFDDNSIDFNNDSDSVDLVIRMKLGEPLVINIPLSLDNILLPAVSRKPLSYDDFMEIYRGLPQDSLCQSNIENSRINNIGIAKVVLTKNRIYFGSQYQTHYAFTAQLATGGYAIITITFLEKNTTGIMILSNHKSISKILLHLVSNIMK